MKKKLRILEKALQYMLVIVICLEFSCYIVMTDGNKSLMTSVGNGANGNNNGYQRNQPEVLFLIKDDQSITAQRYNTKALQEAIDRISEAGGGTVYLPAGNYHFARGGKALCSGGNCANFIIKPRNNVHLVGAGVDENDPNGHTTLYPHFNYDDVRNEGNVDKRADGSAWNAQNGLDMFYFNQYVESNFNKDEVQTSSHMIKYDDSKKVVSYEQTLYLINADFSDFIVDGIYVNVDTKQDFTGKAFMINLFKDCDWENVVVKNTVATGFGMDCPINSTITNCMAVGCGRSGTKNTEGSSGFGIGTGYSNEESMIIKDSVSLNNRKFGYFFESQARFSDDSTRYPATTSSGFVVENSIAGGNLYDFGGLKAVNVTYSNVRSISGDSKYNGIDIINQNNENKLFFGYYSAETYTVNSNMMKNVTDVNQYNTEIEWAINNGFMSLDGYNLFNPKRQMTRFEAIQVIYNYFNRDSKFYIKSLNVETKERFNRITENGKYFKDINQEDYYFITDFGNKKLKVVKSNEIDALEWAVDHGVISKAEKLRGNDPCTRAEFVTMLYKYSNSPKVTGTKMNFSDVSEKDWFYMPVAWGYNNGLIKGTSASTFSPNGKVTKEVLAIFLYRFNTIKNVNNVKYNLLGGEILGRASNSAPTPSKPGYEFVGWTGSNGKTPSKNVSTNNNKQEALVYNANWEPVSISKIEVFNKPSKMSYKMGEDIDTTGLTLKVSYSNDTTEIVSSGYTISPSIASESGSQQVAVIYNDQVCSFNINVDSLSANKVEVNTLPYQTSYYVGDSFSKDGLTLLAKMNDKYAEEVVSGFDVSIKDGEKLELGTHEVQVKYQGLETTFNVEVKEKEISKLIIASRPNKVIYNVGEKFDTTGLKIQVLDSSGAVKEVSSGYTLSISNGHVFTENEVASTKEVTVTYKDQKETFEISIEKIKDCDINSTNVKTEYKVGDKFDSSGLQLVVSYSDGLNKKVAGGFDTSIKDGDKLDKEGTQDVIVSYNGVDKVYKINVKTSLKDTSNYQFISTKLIVILGVIAVILFIGILIVSKKQRAMK